MKASITKRENKVVNLQVMLDLTEEEVYRLIALGDMVGGDSKNRLALDYLSVALAQALGVDPGDYGPYGVVVHDFTL